MVRRLSDSLLDVLISLILIPELRLRQGTLGSWIAWPGHQYPFGKGAFSSRQLRDACWLGGKWYGCRDRCLLLGDLLPNL